MPLAVLPSLPLTEEKSPSALLKFPPLTEANRPLISFKKPTTSPPKLAKLFLSFYLGFFEFVHNVRKRGKALLGALIELLVS